MGEAMALMRSVFTRGPLPHAVLVKSISSFSEK
ncbi:hypothetical protein Ctob_016429, partial [Chrysochromulina tobinii]